MSNTFNNVYELSQKNNISMRMASYKISLEHLNKVYKLKGNGII